MLKRYLSVLLFISLFISCSVSRIVYKNEDSVILTEKIEIGGVQQAVVIRGENLSNPVLVHIHGGPGYPLFPYINNFLQLEKHFTIVYWEQRGTARSLSRQVRDESMTTDTLLSDLHQVIEYSKKFLNKKKVFLWGHSWGTNLGMLYLARNPENVIAYVGSGQSVNLYKNERLCLEYAKSSSTSDNNKEAIKELNGIDTTNYTLDDALKVRKWVYTYGGIVHKVDVEKPYVNFDIVKDVFRTPEYNLADKLRLILRSKYSGKTLWDDMMAIDLFKQVPVVDVPVHFFLGKYDHLVSSKLAETYFNFLKARKSKNLIWFNESAHRPQTEEPEKFLNEMVKVKALYIN